MNNVPENIKAKMGRNLHLKSGHPLCTIREMIYASLPDFKKFDDFQPTVTVEKNFDVLLIPKDHPSRRPSDTYYCDDKHVLRTHTSAHQVDLLSAGEEQFLVTGDVYRKDEIDATHYPVFHQMEGVKLTSGDPEEDLKTTINGVLKTLFPGSTVRWKPDYFPFTEPSFEVEVDLDGRPMEVLGCGVIQPQVLKNGSKGDKKGWAFGLGLERLAMKLFAIPDIRLFWSNDQRFLSQFKPGEVTKFQPFSRHPACYKDIAFWTKPGYEVKDFMDVIRKIAGDLVENVKEIDTFEKNGIKSFCYRIMYRSMERTLGNEEVDRLQDEIRLETRKLPVDLR